MNARLYDPRIGRFFSPDNYISDPQNPQSYNRYSYALNNPLSYTDPSGNAHIQPNTEEFSGLTIISTPIQNRLLNEGGLFAAAWDMGFEGSTADLFDCLFGPVKTYFGGGGGGGGEKEEKKEEYPLPNKGKKVDLPSVEEMVSVYPSQYVPGSYEYKDTKNNHYEHQCAIRMSYTFDQLDVDLKILGKGTGYAKAGYSFNEKYPLIDPTNYFIRAREFREALKMNFRDPLEFNRNNWIESSYYKSGNGIVVYGSGHIDILYNGKPRGWDGTYDSNRIYFWPLK